MPEIVIEQKSMLTDASDSGLFLRIKKEHVPQIKEADLLDRKLDIKIIITY